MSLASPWTKTGLNAEKGKRPSSASELQTSCNRNDEMHLGTVLSAGYCLLVIFLKVQN